MRAYDAGETGRRGAERDFARHCDEIRALCAALGRRVQLMEVCGTHTTSIFRAGIRALLPASLRLVSGPGCPVCVTSQADVELAIELAARPGVILATYGDMLRVPGRSGSLESRRAAGADVRVVASAAGALRIARANPDREVVFHAVGFETTAPATAVVVQRAEREGLTNFSALVSHKRIVPVMRVLLEAGDVPIDGFLCPGHVSVIIGAEAYRPIVERFGKPCVVAGFEAPQILLGLVRLLRQIERGEARLENVYESAARAEGNPVARALLADVFALTSARWRGLGELPDSGLGLAPRYARFDATQRFGLRAGAEQPHPSCRCGEVIQGRIDPCDCPLFGAGCSPLNPLGPCMVSSEGTCAAWFKYRPTNTSVPRRVAAEVGA